MLQGFPELALDPLQRGLALLKELMPPDHPSLAAANAKVSEAYANLGRVEEANEARRDCLLLHRRSQTRCSGPDCERRVREDGAPLDVCVKCRRTFYCSKECQTADWKETHRAECKRLVAEAAGSKYLTVLNLAYISIYL